MSGPMDPERLAELGPERRGSLAECMLIDRLDELLAHADHWEAEATKARDEAARAYRACLAQEARAEKAEREAKRLASKWAGAVTDSDSNAVIAQDTDDENARLRAEVQRYRVMTSKLTVERDALLVTLDDSRGETFAAKLAADKWRADMRDSLARTMRSLGSLADTDTTRDHVLGLAWEIERAVADTRAAEAIVRKMVVKVVTRFEDDEVDQ